MARWQKTTDRGTLSYRGKEEKMKRRRLSNKGKLRKGFIVRSLPLDASYQGVNERGNPLYFSKSTGKTYESLGGYGTPLFGKPRAGRRFKVL